MIRLMQQIVTALPVGIRRHIRPVYLQVLEQMVQFGMVGFAGFAVDTAVVYAIRDQAGLYLAGTFAYVVAVTTTWWLNRIWTFRGRGRPGPLHRQWAKFVIANLPGLCLNLGTYFVLVTIAPLCAAHPVLAILAGAIAGMTANFTLSRAVVFR